MPIRPKAKEAVEWYTENKVIYQALAKRVESIVREILDSKKIIYHSVSSREKPIDSYERKASLDKYKDPRSEIRDMAGIRIITYIDSDANDVFEIIKDVFEIHPQHTVDKSKELGVNKVGYRSIHCVGTLGKERQKLPENKIFKDMCFEIQVRTILQHAWAEFEHDRNYKFRGVLPKGIRRRFSILAGSLELIDREFDSISEAIDIYAKEVGRKTELGDLDVPIDSTSLKEYASRRFKALIEKGVHADLVDDKDIVEQIQDMGINTLQELDDLIMDDYIETKSKYIVTGEGLYSILIDILIVHDIEAYFEKAWKTKWRYISTLDTQLYKHFGIDLEEYAKKLGIEISEQNNL